VEDAVPTLQFAVQATQLDENLGIATSTLVFLRSLGQAFGVAIGGTVFQNQFNRHVRDTVAAGVIPVEMAIDGKDAEGLMLQSCSAQTLYEQRTSMYIRVQYTQYGTCSCRLLAWG
jgi:hypothetical protein